jgi:hypothetical protein
MGVFAPLFPEDAPDGKGRKERKIFRHDGPGIAAVGRLEGG